MNNRLQWQIDNKFRGLRFIPLNPNMLKLFCFVDGSFANNKDFSSQIGKIIVLGNEKATSAKEEILVEGNIVDYGSVKSHRVTRSVLASELYSMVLGVDTIIALGTTMSMIAAQLGIPDVPIVICTDSFSLYECLVKLGTTKEKRLMIDIMAIRQSYERRELQEIRWIRGTDNPADAMTKAAPNKVLQSLVEKNEMRIHVEGWVERPDMEETDINMEKEMNGDS